MPDKPKTVRLPQVDHDFIDRSEFNFSREVKQFIHEERIERAIGRCAACGVEVYEGGGHAQIEQDSEFYEILDLEDYSDDLEVCGECFDQVKSVLLQTEKENPTPEYLETVGPNIYRVERLAIKDARADTYWSGLLEEPDENLKTKILADWVNHSETDFPTSEVPEELAEAIGM
ncbi:hypothetical protein [Haloarcula sp. Atlit-7R]|uniref:hypothetical protein n=1 Tax=Haloarcula sp. Atlit-7R TaxID=2282125 RepID=UPI000EF15D92|nr:hypothetical protein [Haloarcula sp. Atlit-7R]RLM94384.1 hypothetical protein D3D01_16100 [Haloarcula sp. Atlit-7R]